MMKLNLILEEIINELTATQIKDKYYSDIDTNTFNEIVSADPKTNVYQGDIKKIGKYSKLLLKIYLDGNLKMEDLPKAKEYLTVVYKKKIGLDMKKINSISDIYPLVKNHIISYGEVDVNKLTDELVLGQDYELKFNGEKWLVFIPKTEKAACVLGSATEWCTTWGKHSINPSYKDRSNHFKRHENNLFIIINKDDNSIKYQFHEDTNQYMDKGDRGINVGNFLDENEELDNFFNPEFINGLDKIRETDLDSMINRRLISNTKSSQVIKMLVDTNKDMPIVKMFLNASNSGDYEEINSAIGSSDMVIEDIDSKDVRVESLGELYDIYRHLGNSGYYDNDYGDYSGDAQYYYDNSMEEIFNVNKSSLETQFISEGGIDIKEFLEYLNNTRNGLHGVNDGEYNAHFLGFLIDNSGNKEKFIDEISEIVNMANRTANSDAEDEVKDKLENHVDVAYKDININTFMLFLIRNDYYDMNTFNQFLTDTFDIPVEYHDVHEEIDEIKQRIINVDINEITVLYDNYEYDMVAWFLEEYEDEFTFFSNMKNGDDDDNHWLSNNEESYYQFFYELQGKIMAIIKKYTGKTNTMIRNHHSSLNINLKRLNVPKEMVFINFESGSKTFNGYVKINQLGRYFNLGEVSTKFWSDLDRIMTDMNFDMNQDEFENGMVKLKINYKEVDYESNSIFIELLNKNSGEVISGFTNIESIPTHFTNYKLFEVYLKFKKIIF